MISYGKIRRLIVERISEIRYDLDKNKERHEELVQELRENEEALEELEKNKGRYFDERV